MTAPGHVNDDEELYRRIQSDPCLFSRQPNGLPRFSASAFNDRNNEPSVDRASICNNNPSHTQLAVTDGVISLYAGEVRAIEPILQRDEKGKEVINRHKIDVKADPINDHPSLADNPAHAKIYAQPAFANRSVFMKLKERLAKLVSDRPWTIGPI